MSGTLQQDCVWIALSRVLYPQSNNKYELWTRQAINHYLGPLYSPRAGVALSSLAQPLLAIGITAKYSAEPWKKVPSYDEVMRAMIVPKVMAGEGGFIIAFSLFKRDPPATQPKTYQQIYAHAFNVVHCQTHTVHGANSPCQTGCTDLHYYDFQASGLCPHSDYHLQLQNWYDAYGCTKTVVEVLSFPYLTATQSIAHYLPHQPAHLTNSSEH